MILLYVIEYILMLALFVIPAYMLSINSMLYFFIKYEADKDAVNDFLLSLNKIIMKIYKIPCDVYVDRKYRLNQLDPVFGVNFIRHIFLLICILFIFVGIIEALRNSHIMIINIISSVWISNCICLLFYAWSFGIKTKFRVKRN